ncbi:hypothetical protein [Methylibium sp. Root1272]|uniref:hypothetical protein n=1 Tax=Methylibium sp. Root1272 TaxID=1736441 RepID=UPI0006FD7655|nr:hypothetical protein [Methylibium sp. Root1272]KQW69886.1 hypothetical protein ASC67_05210 [Methylibium sp. Root1272]
MNDLRVELDGGLVRLTRDRPAALNAPDVVLAEALAQRLERGPTRASGRIRGLVRSLAELLDTEHEAVLACAASADFREGREAFFARRAPHCEGR